MKALSLWQPWASLIVYGAKTVETRSWSTPYRGPLAIHAAKWKTDADAEEVWRFAVECTDLVPADAPERARDLTTGAILATCDLVNVEPTSACGCHDWLKQCPRHRACESEFGNFEEGRFFWTLENVKPLVPPVAFRGAQGLFEWPATGAAVAVETAHEAREKKQGSLW